MLKVIIHSPQFFLKKLIKCREKRSDCSFVTLALVLDSSGFPKRSKVFEGNVSEPSTLARMIKEYDKVLEKIGRLKQQYSKAAKHYKIEVSKDEKSGNAVNIILTRQTLANTKNSLPGVYCFRTTHMEFDEAALWRTYTMLTDLEAVFRSLKSELGMRPGQKNARDG